MTTHVPTSIDYHCLDASETALSNFLTAVEVTPSRSSPYVVYSGGAVVVMSDDGVESAIDVELPVSEIFTIRFEFDATHLPDDLTAPSSHRFFMGAYNQTGKCAGVLVSKAGFAVVPTPTTVTTPIPGTQTLFSDGGSYVLRMIVDNDGTLNVYVTNVSDLASGEVLRWTAMAQDTPLGYSNGMILDIVGQSASPVEVHFTAIQSDCWRALYPAHRPVAVCGADQTVVGGSVIALNGSQSYDPDSRATVLTYDWELVFAPDNSRFKIFEYGGFAVGGSLGFTNVFSATVGSKAFSVDNAPLLQPGDTLVLTLAGERHAFTVSTTGWVELDGKWARSTDAGWNDDQVAITESDIPMSSTGVAWAVLHSEAFFNSTSAATPYCVPDVAGLYEVQLVVAKGLLKSLPVTQLLNVQATSAALGVVPDMSFIWDHLTNFWSLLEDRDKLTTVWSGFAQSVANILLTAWQIDYNKSLKDIQRTFQRRWLSYSTVVEDSSEDIRIVRGKIMGMGNYPGPYSLNGLTLNLIIDNSSIITVTFTETGSVPLAAWAVAEQINAAVTAAGYQPVASSSGAFLLLEYPQGLLQVLDNGTANVPLGFASGSTPLYVQNNLWGNGAVTTSTQVRTTSFLPGPRVDIVAANVGADDILVLSDGQVTPVRNTVEAGVIDQYQYFNVILPLATNPSINWEVPSVVTSTSLNFEDELVSPADLARFSVRDLSTNASVDVYCNILGVSGSKLGFDARPLLRAFNGTPAAYAVVFTGVKKTNCLRVDDLVSGIPRLQETVASPSSILEENKDYRVGKIAANGKVINAITFAAGAYTYLSPPPDTLWAETTFLDNRPAIEANFGRMVPPFSTTTYQDVEKELPNLDYLSAVQGLWYAYWGGPSIYRMRVGLQILLGLPFAEEDGVVTEVNEHFSAREGRILIQDKNGAIVRSYFYPAPAGIMVWETPDPKAGQKLKVGDSVSKFTPLSGGIEILDWVNSPALASNITTGGLISGLQKYFKFMVRGNVDAFDPMHIIFALDFIKSIKPHYTYPVVVLQKLLKMTIDVQDAITQNASIKVVQTTDPEGWGAFRWDDYDGAGVCRHAFDEAFPQFVWDHIGLSPRQTVNIQSTLSSDAQAAYMAFISGDQQFPRPLTGLTYAQLAYLNLVTG